jgi:osmotically-inducible protein OsmY
MGGTRDGTYLDGWVDDDELKMLVLGRLSEDACWWNADGDEPMIHVIVSRGFVTLSGIVQSSADRLRASAVARAAGALGVDNRLIVDSDVRRRST